LLKLAGEYSPGKSRDTKVYKSPVPTSPGSYAGVTIFFIAFVAGGLAWDWDWKMTAMGGVFAVIFGFLTVWSYFDDKRIAKNRAADMKRREREIAENRVPKANR